MLKTMILTLIENVSSAQAALLGCSLSVAALASVRGHHGQVRKTNNEHYNK